MPLTLEPLSPLKTARRDKIIGAAQQLFVAQGFRATTMEGVADAVGMSKVTVYSYFRDKDALFAAVAIQLVGTMHTAIQEALETPGSIAEQVSAAIVAKTRIVSAVVRSSAFAHELFAAKDRVVADVFQEFDEEVRSLLSNHLQNGGESKAQADTLARLILNGSLGVANHEISPEQVEEDIRLLVYALLTSHSN